MDVEIRFGFPMLLRRTSRLGSKLWTWRLKFIRSIQPFKLQGDIIVATIIIISIVITIVIIIGGIMFMICTKTPNANTQSP